MKPEDRRLVIRYLNNVLKGSLSPQLQENLWSWAERHGQEVFRLDLERLGDQAAEAIEVPNSGRSRRSDDRRVREAKNRLLKKTAAE
jgi:hypothetical protein